MAHLFTFSSTKFDDHHIDSKSHQPACPGASVLQWLREELNGSLYESTAPETEDCGWSVYVNGAWRLVSLVGASAETDCSESSRGLARFKCHKQRSLMDKVRGATDRLACSQESDDPL